MGKVRSVDVGKRLRLVPYWERAFVDFARTNVIIDPGPSFGAGDHPSTVMALELLESAVEVLKRARPSPTMLDAGTGTGVLGIAAKALGSGFTVGFDTDSAAVFSARRNLQLNGMAAVGGTVASSMELFVGGADSVKGVFDIVAANLAAPTLVKLSVELKKLVGSHLILSGIADPMEEAVVGAYSSVDLDLVERMEHSGWHALLIARRI